MKINSLIVEIDGIDKEILRDLMEDAKTILQIANKIGLGQHSSAFETRTIGCYFRIKITVNNYSVYTMAFVGVYLDKAEMPKLFVI
jgi:Lrp/AsnC family transcriptional regulator for asnA, asnC and gidA